MDVQVDKCSLNLYDVYVAKSEFLRQDNYSLDNNKLKFNINVKNSLNDEKSTCKLVASINIIDEINQSIKIYVEMVGIFGLKNYQYLSESARFDLLHKNTLAILFPYIRSYITNLSSQSGIQSIMLPPININALISRKIEDNET